MSEEKPTTATEQAEVAEQNPDVGSAAAAAEHPDPATDSPQGKDIDRGGIPSAGDASAQTDRPVLPDIPTQTIEIAGKGNSGDKVAGIKHDLNGNITGLYRCTPGTRINCKLDPGDSIVFTVMDDDQFRVLMDDLKGSRTPLTDPPA
jgi:hypothetical protein